MKRGDRMVREICLRCGGEMAHMGQDKIQLGKYGMLLGAWSNLLSGALTVDIYCCKKCKKLEFYAVEGPEEEENTMTKVECPYCGVSHELDDVKCPHCGNRLY